MLAEHCSDAYELELLIIVECREKLLGNLKYLKLHYLAPLLNPSEDKSED